MTGNAFLRCGVCILILGVSLGMYMGMKQDFTMAPVHAHLNLAGGVLLMVAGLFYKAHPHLPKALMTTHLVLHVAGVLMFTGGIAAEMLKYSWSMPLIGVGSLCLAAAILLFAYMIFRGTSQKA